MKTIEPCTLVIFGAAGNLSRLKLIPALFSLEKAGRLPERLVLLACNVEKFSRDAWIEDVRKIVEPLQTADAQVMKRFLARWHYHSNAPGDENAYPQLQQMIEKDEAFPPNVVYYMAVRPTIVQSIIEKLGEAGLLKQKNGWRRVVIEKPFGYDLLSAQTLQASLYRHLDEPQIFRIDHYLGKGTVRNVMVFRFANILLEPLWNHHYIDHVQITHSETIGIEGRADYYDGAGALRDMIQSHLLQLLALVAMEPPVSMSAEHLRDEKVKVLQAIRPITQKSVNAHAFRGQYSSGTIDGKAVLGYQEEAGIPDGSSTETYAALKLFIDNWRWSGVPFYLRTGKRMADASSAICIRFKNPPQDLLRHTRTGPQRPNWIMLGIQPHDTMKMEMQVKVPGLDLHTRTMSLDATYRKGEEQSVDAYEGLLLDVMLGDQSLFLRIDEVEAAWRVVDPVIKVWAMERGFVTQYPAGTAGPRGTYRLFDREDQFWRQSLNLDGADVQPY